MTFLAIKTARQLFSALLLGCLIGQPTVRADEMDGRLGAVAHAYNMT
jgi:hypothetical protein